MIKLTQYETNEPVYVLPEAIMAVIQIPSSGPTEIAGYKSPGYARRCRVRLSEHDCVIVNEEATDIMKMIEDAL